MNKPITECIDYTNLKADAGRAVIEKLCREAVEHNCASVCVNPCHVVLAKTILNGSRVGVCTVVGFPLGATTTEAKAFEATQAIGNGATEIDMVANIGAIKDASFDYVCDDIKGVHDVCKKHGALLKVIIETCLLTDIEKKTVAKIICDLGVDFVKTSTGFSSGGATMDDIKLLKSVVGNRARIKASGGIKDYQTAKQMLDAGADRLGTSTLIKDPE